MAATDNIHAVLDAIQRGSRFLITAHARPDGDAVGSMLACGMILEQLGKQVDIASCDRVPLIYRDLPCASDIRYTTLIDSQYDAVILLECDSIDRSRLAGIGGQFLINIDHHTSGRQFGRINWIDTDACAVGEMIFRLAQAPTGGSELVE